MDYWTRFQPVKRNPNDYLMRFNGAKRAINEDYWTRFVEKKRSAGFSRDERDKEYLIRFGQQNPSEPLVGLTH